ncbi:hypothetical protein AB0J83_50060 [Actinoplanes sp. NPDC049596]|uniref:hypothetical protein n=1 Tax=unclassified Actinoplanes TaxID=2626549 RepID=UPI003447FFD0
MDDEPTVFEALPGRPAGRKDAFEALQRELAQLVGVEAEVGHRIKIKRAVDARVKQGGPVPEEWFAPLIRTAIHDPDPSFVRFFILPAIRAFGRERVMVALIEQLETGSAADAAGAARAWYAAAAGVEYRRVDTEMALVRWYFGTALRRFVTDEDLDVRRCILPLLPLRPGHYPEELHDLVTQAVAIARTSDDGYLRHRVEIQVRSRG